MNRNIEAWTRALTDAVEELKQRVRLFFYEIVLSGQACPCCRGALRMARDGECQCEQCGYRFDPTLALQRCAICGGKLKLEGRQYRCSDCGSEVESRYRFDPIRFDSEYFRKAMAEHRRRKAQQQRLFVETLINARTGHVILPPADLDGLPGLTEAINELTAKHDEDSIRGPLADQRFDLAKYERHVIASITDSPVDFDDISPLLESLRKDRIWRFVAVIFLAHEGRINIHQEGSLIELTAHETHREGRSVPQEA